MNPSVKTFFLFLVPVFFCVPLFAGEPGSVTNTGNIAVHVQYKTADADYQDMVLQPGESKDLPGGVEKVKVVREPGEWASPAKAGETIEVTVKEGDKVVGTAGWYGAKVFFSSPTAAPSTQLVIQGEQPPAETPAAGSQTSGAESAEATEKPLPYSAQLGVEPDSAPEPKPGSITNNGYLPMTITFHGTYGPQQVFLKPFETAEIPLGATGMSIHEPRVYSAYTFGKKAVDLVIVKPAGETVNVTETPFEGLEMNLKEPAYRLNYEWKLDMNSKLKLGFGDEYKSWDKNNSGRDARDAQSEESDLRIHTELKYEY